MKTRGRERAVECARHGALFALLCAPIILTALPAAAERSDRNKPVNLEADHMTVDDAKHVATFEGNVVLTQGTLVIRGDRMVVQQDAAGFQYGTAYGNPANFRQKRDKRDEYVEGYGARIEYDNKTNRVQLFDHARLKKAGDEVRGEHISYDQTTELYRVVGSEQTTTAGPHGRVRAVIEPKSRNAPQKTPPLTLKATTQVAPPDDSSSTPAR
ncbi:MAG TPA: lipopolysaccharide transport periplasmic protein LptA [Burkholderiales bacterium]|nr:lipopolysaccharide transport periplasmic protein LptA [Burkholderiales bacterium]